MSNSPIPQNLLRVTFTLTNNNATFQGTGSNVLQLVGLRMVAQIEGAGGQSFPTMLLKIYGMAQADMNALAVQLVSGGNTDYTRNTVLVEANAGQNGAWVAVFSGSINEAGPDYDGAPEVCLSVKSLTNYYDLLAPAPVTSFPSATDVSTVVSFIAKQLGCAFENDGVSVILPSFYLTGTYADQLRTACDHANINWYRDPVTNSLAITMKGAARTAPPVFVLTPDNGLVSYPKPLGNGYIQLRCLFNASIRSGGAITIQGSDAVVDPNAPTTYNSKADGNWVVGPLRLLLDCLKPGGAWFCDMQCWPPDAPPGASVTP